HDEAAARLAQRLHQRGAAVTLLVLVAAAEAAAHRQQELASTLRPQGAAGNAPGFSIAAASQRAPADAVIAEARPRYELIVLGMGPDWELPHAEAGLGADALLQRCPASLCIVRAAAPEPERVARRQSDPVARAG